MEALHTATAEPKKRPRLRLPTEDDWAELRRWLADPRAAAELTVAFIRGMSGRPVVIELPDREAFRIPGRGRVVRVDLKEAPPARALAAVPVKEKST